MEKYRAIVLFPEGAGEQRYEFEAPQNYMENSPSRIVDTFLSTVVDLGLPGEPVDNEINAAHNYRDIRTVSASGAIFLRTGQAVPFVMMLSPAQAA